MDECREPSLGIDRQEIGKKHGLTGEAGESLISTVALRLGRRPAALILDNFEQLVTAAPLVGDLAGRAEELRILVTSRATLHLSGEYEFPVPPLALPDLTHLPAPETLRQQAAVQ